MQSFHVPSAATAVKDFYTWYDWFKVRHDEEEEAIASAWEEEYYFGVESPFSLVQNYSSAHLEPLTCGDYVYHVPDRFPLEHGLSDIHRMFEDPDEGLEDIALMWLDPSEEVD